MSQLNREQRRARIKANRATVANQPDELRLIPCAEWPQTKPPENLSQVWMSKKYLVQIYTKENQVRVSVNRTTLNKGGERWDDGLSWEELQSIKSQVGYGDFDAVEVYPRDVDVVNVANMRHLWILNKPLGFVWRRSA